MSVAGWRVRMVLCAFVVCAATAAGAARAAAATYTVNDAQDTTSVYCDANAGASGSPCTLREALSQAVKGDTINFGFSGPETIALDPSLGPLVVASDGVTITGPDNGTVIDGGATSTAAGTTILQMGPHVTDLTVTGLTLQNGTAVALPIGTGVYDGETAGGAIQDAGGGGSLTVADDQFVGDSAGDVGGAISVTGANKVTLSISDSTFDDDTAGGDGATGGGAVYFDGGPGPSPLTVTGSTFADDSVTGTSAYGGAIDVQQGTVSITNSTLTGNSAPDGGALATGNGTTGPASNNPTQLVDDTIDANQATNGGGVGGILGAAGVNAYGTIVSFNTAPVPVPPSGGAGRSADDVVTQVVNCDEPVNDAGTGAGQTNDSIEGPATTDDSCGFAFAGAADLAPLADNGGPTETQAIDASSPAIGGVPASACDERPFVDVDQRGEPRPGAGESNCDLGAYEYQAPVSSNGSGGGGSPSPTSPSGSSSPSLPSGPASSQLTLTTPTTSPLKLQANITPSAAQGYVTFSFATSDPTSIRAVCSHVPVASGVATCSPLLTPAELLDSHAEFEASFSGSGYLPSDATQPFQPAPARVSFPSSQGMSQGSNSSSSYSASVIWGQQPKSASAGDQVISAEAGLLDTNSLNDDTQLARGAAVIERRSTNPRVVIGEVKVRVHPGQRDTIRIPLNALGRKLHATHRRLHVILFIAEGDRLTTHTVTIVGRPRRTAHHGRHHGHRRQHRAAA